MHEKASIDAASSRGSAYALLPLVVVIWGVNWPLMKLGLAFMPPLWFSATRSGFGAACLFVFLAATGRLAVPTRRELPVLLSVGLLQMALFQPLVNDALRHVAAGRAAVLVYTTPLWVTPGAVLLLGETLTPLKLVGLGCGLVGVAALFDPSQLDWSQTRVLIGSGQLMLASLLWAITILHLRGRVYHLSPLQLTPWQLLLAFACLLPAALFFEHTSDIHWNRTLACVVLYNGPITTAFSYWAANQISRTLPAITTSLSFLGVPAIGILVSVCFLGETPDRALLVGFGLILVGVVLVNLADSRPRVTDASESTGA